MQVCWLEVPDAPVAAPVLHNTAAHKPGICRCFSLQQQQQQVDCVICIQSAATMYKQEHLQQPCAACGYILQVAAASEQLHHQATYLSACCCLFGRNNRCSELLLSPLCL
jgi:hypothetical protein